MRRDRRSTGWPSGLRGLERLPFFAPAPRLGALTHADLDQAWQVLRLVLDWIRHAEAKAVAALAASGVLGGLLYQLVNSRRSLSVPFIVFAILCAVAVVTAGLCAGAALRPQMTIRTGAPSLLYFHDVARSHPRRGGGFRSYLEAMSRVGRSPELLFREVVAQIWANAHVATAKYRWSSLAIIAILAALLTLAAAALANALTA